MHCNSCLTVQRSSSENSRSKIFPRLAERMRSSIIWHPLRPIYTEELPGVAAHDALFVSMRPGVAVHERRITWHNKTKKRARLLLATPQCRLAFRHQRQYLSQWQRMWRKHFLEANKCEATKHSTVHLWWIVHL